MGTMNRRAFLRHSGAAALVVGFSPATRTWATTASGDHGEFDAVPPLDGVLLQDPASRTLAADDYGHIIHHEPWAVLRPGSVHDIQKIVGFAREHGLKVSVRGNGHSAYGQAQVEEGIVVDSSTLSQIHDISSERAVVGAGVLWRTLISAAATHDATPPVLADYQSLSVGGTLSLGGVDSGPMAHGAQADTVLELDVVTGTGDLITCSPSRSPELFRAVLGGLGQCGIIVRATLRLVPMPASALLVRLRYDDVEAALHDTEVLLADGRFNAFEHVVNHEDGRWILAFQGAVFFTPPDLPDVDAITRGLGDDRSRRVIAPIPYLAWPFRLDPLIAAAEATAPRLPRPIVNGMVPVSDPGRAFMKRLFARSFEELGRPRGFVLGGTGAHIRQGLLQVPRTDLFYAFLLARNANEADSRTSEAALLAQNRDLHDEFVAIGGKRYPWDAVPGLTRSDWARHFGPDWGFLERSKNRFDPDDILASGQRIFA